jgi:hypothetical protein
MQQQQPAEVSDGQIIEQALACTSRSGWTVQSADCRVQRTASEALTHEALTHEALTHEALTHEALTQRGTPDAWMVYMWAQPHVNATLLKPMPLGCRVQLLDGRLCAVNLYEPSDREPYLR